MMAPYMTTTKAAPGTTRCPQCWKFRKNSLFVEKDGGVRKNCRRCRARMKLYRQGVRLNLAGAREGLPKMGELRVAVTLRSQSKKLGHIPSTMTTPNSCPPSCSFFGNGCYAEYHLTKFHWKKTPKRGLLFNDFLDWVRALPPDTLWRHNVAGDLPGIGDQTFAPNLAALALANSGRRGFTFTHKPLRSEKLRNMIRNANEIGFTINLSADSLDDADAKLALGIAPVAVVLPHDAPNTLFTPAGNRVFVCPAQTERELSCAECQVCARPKRTSIVGFRAHGQGKLHVTELVQLRARKDSTTNGEQRAEAPNEELLNLGYEATFAK